MAPQHTAERTRGLAANPVSSPEITAPTLPAVEASTDGDRDAAERDGDEHPAQRIEVRHQRQGGGLRLSQNLARWLGFLGKLR